MSTEICLLTYNRLPLIMACLKSLSHLLNDTNYQFRIVDNRSSEDVIIWLMRLRKNYHNVEIIFNTENQGVAGARDYLFRTSQADKIVSLDSDIIASDAKLIPLMEKALDDPDVGIVGAGGHWLTRQWNPLAAADEYLGDVHVLSGFCHGFRREILDVAQLDLDFNFNGVEDDDFCLQIRQQGYRVVQQDFPIRHLFSGTWAGNGLGYEANRRRLYEKWKDIYQTPIIGQAMELKSELAKT